MLFEKDYLFKGIHAERVKQMADSKPETADIDFYKTRKIFGRYVDVYLLAPIVGFLKGRRAAVDKSSSATANIMASMMIQNRSELLFTYRLIMLLDKDYEPDQTERINKAFRYYGDEEKTKKDMERFEEYVRGGVDYLYETLWENSVQPEDYINNLYDLVEDFHSKYGDVSKDILDLCKVAMG